MHLIFFCYHLKNIFSFLYCCFILCNPISESWAFLKLKSFWRSGKLLLASSHAFWVSRHSFQIATWWSDRECTKKKKKNYCSLFLLLGNCAPSIFPLFHYPGLISFSLLHIKYSVQKKWFVFPFLTPFFTDHTQ